MAFAQLSPAAAMPAVGSGWLAVLVLLGFGIAAGIWRRAMA